MSRLSYKIRILDLYYQVKHIQILFLTFVRTGKVELQISYKMLYKLSISFTVYYEFIVHSEILELSVKSLMRDADYS